MQGKTPAVLFVCTANVCRSPMAAGLFQALLSSRLPGGGDWLVDSAGTWASEGQRASENAVRVMQKRGIDLSQHRSKVVSRALLNLFDLILVMEPGHKEALRVEFPEVAGRVWLLSELSGPPLPIEDPYGLSLEHYEKTASEIEAYLQAGFPEILARVGWV
ncbi:MAG TPA: low molecular weight protein arginine phosphatase [Anaerolinea thermolimosa]|uniref:Low molecular weight protein arginine phosphatase n=1 Tax=Anaerolinea thermolimosa TaxID=229919 RepID=A0A3D1JFQ2_9CHLR|nr:low molecular weight protein arginine phosphatase [Anaerolinea thermolimosa]GAP05770.1 protein-tyrosine-phosphatase [Anaerolinea thermolimosa]HCE17284.1 low molecular weight protein arginine phosphatase [Anaerolinea thermolimosa]